jgi:hypothetical protein
MKYRTSNPASVHAPTGTITLSNDCLIVNHLGKRASRVSLGNQSMAGGSGGDGKRMALKSWSRLLVCHKKKRQLIFWFHGKRSYCLVSVHTQESQPALDKGNLGFSYFKPLVFFLNVISFDVCSSLSSPKVFRF